MFGSKVSWRLWRRSICAAQPSGYHFIAFPRNVLDQGGDATWLRASRATAFALARRRLTATAKENMLPQTDGLLLSIARELAAEYSDIDFER